MTSTLAADHRTAQRTACPCGFPLVPDNAEPGSPEWHRQHRDHHIATFPNLDANSIRNLNDFITWAAADEQEQTPAGDL